jgi:hypothetical protein
MMMSKIECDEELFLGSDKVIKSTAALDESVVRNVAMVSLAQSGALQKQRSA